MNEAFLCLGGNMGDRLALIKEAKRQIILMGCDIVSESGVYQTEAWGTENGPEFYNQVIKVETGLSALNLMQGLLIVEKNLGRERTDDKNAPRLMDIDILFYNEEIIKTELLELPHPRLQLRNFVLVPLNEIAGEFVHPVFNKSIHVLMNECNDKLKVKLVE